MDIESAGNDAGKVKIKNRILEIRDDLHKHKQKDDTENDSNADAQSADDGLFFGRCALGQWKCTAGCQTLTLPGAG